jgi:drug/metabolite transporter (DMT)-like permease
LVRIVSGAVALLLIHAIRDRSRSIAGTWSSAFALFWYAGAFSFAYISLPAGTGALLLFGAVQATMILWGMWCGESLPLRQVIGLTLAVVGLVALVFPGLTSPPLVGSILMITAGIAWGVYSLRGKGAGDPAGATTGNFIRAVPCAVVLSLAVVSHTHIARAGLIYAIISGAITSGVGYVLWYCVLPSLKAASAATVQLIVPVIAAIGGIALLGEAVTFRLVVASVAVLSAIAIVVIDGSHARA